MLRFFAVVRYPEKYRYREVSLTHRPQSRRIRMKNYIKKQVQPMEPWTPETNMEFVSISQADMNNASPKEGDMIAYGADPRDRWLVAKDYFEANYIEAPPTEQECEL